MLLFIEGGLKMLDKETKEKLDEIIKLLEEIARNTGSYV